MRVKSVAQIQGGKGPLPAGDHSPAPRRTSRVGNQCNEYSYRFIMWCNDLLCSSSNLFMIVTLISRPNIHPSTRSVAHTEVRCLDFESMRIYWADIDVLFRLIILTHHTTNSRNRIMQIEKKKKKKTNAHMHANDARPQLVTC